MLKLKDVEEMAETILNEVDYDIYKEDLEDREILDCIEFHLMRFAEQVEKSIKEE